MNYYTKNKEIYKNYYQDNREKLIQQSIDYYNKNKDIIREKQNEYYKSYYDKNCSKIASERKEKYRLKKKVNRSVVNNKLVVLLPCIELSNSLRVTF